MSNAFVALGQSGRAEEPTAHLFNSLLSSKTSQYSWWMYWRMLYAPGY